MSAFERRAGYFKRRNEEDGSYTIYEWPSGRHLGFVLRDGREWKAVFARTGSDHPTLKAAAIHLVELHRLADEVLADEATA